MSSSSVSSSCSYGPYNYILEDSYGRLLSPNPQFPFYRTMGQPLVYYAQIQKPEKRSSKGKQRKEKRNCFVKAFHWYTQERESKRVPKKNAPPSNMTGFANWLDAKYGEYLRDSEINQIVLEKTSTIQTTSCTTWRTESRRKKRFPRMKSPWRRRRNDTKSRRLSPTNQPSPSCKFILKPKNESCHASEHSCRLTTKTYRIESNTAEVGRTKNATQKSQSLTCICPENIVSNTRDPDNSQRLKTKEVEKHTTSNDVKREQPSLIPNTPMPCCDNNTANTNDDKGGQPANVIQQEPAKLPKLEATCLIRHDTQETLLEEQQKCAMCYHKCIGENLSPVLQPQKHEKDTQKNARSRSHISSEVQQMQSTAAVKKKETLSRHMQTNPSKAETSCQCYEEKPVQVVKKPVKASIYKGTDRPSQKYEKKLKATSNTKFGYDQNKRDRHNLKTYNDINCTCPRPQPETPKDIGNIQQVDDELTTRNMVSAKKYICHTILRNDAVQTSIHSIRLVKDARVDYPLFMKIICPDKLLDCVCEKH